MQALVAVLPGEGDGAEVALQSARVLAAVGQRFGHEIRLETALSGAPAIDACGDPLPPETLALARRADALLLGGGTAGPRWEDPRLTVHPAQGLVRLRRELKLYANLRPVRLFPELVSLSSLKPDPLQGVDLLLVREVGGGVYFGRPHGQWQTKRGRRAVDTTPYKEEEIERVLRVSFELARRRRRHLVSVDKANVLATSRLWRQVAGELAAGYPDVRLEHMLVDNCAVHLMTEPAHFDVIVTENLFGYILQDVAGALAGSHGLLPGGTLGPPKRVDGLPVGLYEPTRGTGPAGGPDVVNPIGGILSAALLLRHSLGLEREAAAVEAAVAAALRRGCRTADLAPGDATALGTTAMTDAVLDALEPAEA